jgi:hypothetical protein
MGYNAAVLTDLKAQLASFPTDKLLQFVQAVDVPNGAVVNSSGTITVAGVALSNLQYYQIFEMIGGGVS